VLTAADFAEWVRLHNASRPASVLATDPRDVELATLDLSGLPAPRTIFGPRGSGDESGGRGGSGSSDGDSGRSGGSGGSSGNGGSGGGGGPGAQRVTVLTFDPGRGLGDLHDLLDATPPLSGEPFDLAVGNKTRRVGPAARVLPPQRLSLLSPLRLSLVWPLLSWRS